MDLSWIATPYGLGAAGMVCALAGFIASRGVYWDKDDKVLKIGSKNHPQTLDLFEELCSSVSVMEADLTSLRDRVTGMNMKLDEVNGKFDSTHQDVKAMANSLGAMKMDQQKQLFYDTDQRPGERMVAGLRYVDMGGNGAVKVDVEDFALDHRDLYDSAVLAAPNLKLASL